ncbi:NAD-dependent succinate-semialdehyde dehydrogenase [Haloarchaeobius salinus]|uniref:NAD-dependent succinate-semialdehyde dehydrogenase n=1 Tax=Haloarchaeobius salinus TaxID=1198298 RepID=UPI002109836D|nr:NAD-dependent succinate-semialdehyde dehydrogenase [Haloarchaeobius salinus]
MQSQNPATERPVREYDSDSDEEIDDALERATTAYDDWRARPIEERQTMLADVASVLRENVEEYAQLITTEMGKPISESRSEVEKCAWVCDYYAEHAGAHLADDRLATVPEANTKVVYEPLGAVLAVMPWNYPFWQVFRFAAPTLTAGNVGLLKHASNVPGCALAIEEIFESAGYPEGVFTTLLVGSGDVERVLADDRVRAATLTGSEYAGRKVAETAGYHLKKTVLELGGSGPYVVLDDADLDAAVETAVTARFMNTGQSCIAAKRFVVVDEVYDEFVDRFTSAAAELTVGDPSADETDIGPLAKATFVDELHEQVEESVEAGAALELGGEPLERQGHYYAPTVLTDVPRSAPAACEETFGPVATVFRVDDEQGAVELANDSRFGLGASVWTQDRDRGERIGRQLETGAVFVNELVKSDPRVPFGGIKASGYGRELSKQGIREFVNRKTLWVQ